MNVALLHPGTSNHAMASLVWPPLGLCRIATHLRRHGHAVRIIEDSLNHYDLERIATEAAGAELVGIGAMTLQAPRAEAAIAAIRRRSAVPIVVGGPHYAATRTLPAGADALVVGDGEQALLEVAQGARGLLEGRSVPEYVPVDFDPIDYPRYGDHLIDGTRAISLLTARGCPFNCRFCGSPALFGRCVTDYSLGEVVENMAGLAERYGLAAFRIMDDTFTLRPARIYEFCDRVDGRGWRMSCLTNVRTVQFPVLRRMRSVGFEFVAVGAESGDDNVLALSGKQQTRWQIQAAVEMIQASGMKAEVLFIIGLPGETRESLQATMKFALGLGAHRVHAQFFTPFPGCEFARDLAKHGRIVEPDYAKWTHRLPVFVPHAISYDALLDGGREFFAALGREVGK